MDKVHLKICGLKDPKIAAKAVELGVDYIGLIFYPPSKRHVDLKTAQSIADSVHEKGGTIVPVFVEQTADAICEISAGLNTKLIQLHGRPAVAAYPVVSKQFSCIIAAHLCDDHHVFNPNRDFLLYDSVTPGSGRTFNWSHKTNKNFRSFIAGGISVDNAPCAIDYFHPFALDVSSGVEDKTGHKDLALIKKLVAHIKH